MDRRKHKPLKFILEGEIEPMSQINATVQFTVNAASSGSSLAFTPEPTTPDTEGVADAGQILGEVTGGTAPYTFTATGVPPGMSLSQAPDADGVGVDVIISGTPTAGDATSSPYTIALTINDSAGASATASVRRR